MEYAGIDPVCQVGKAKKPLISPMLTDPLVRRAFERVERDGGATPAFVTTPLSPVLTGGALVEA